MQHVWSYCWHSPRKLLLSLLGVVVLIVGQDTTTGPPYIMKQPRNMTAVEGQRVLFTCGAEAFPDNITTYWYKDGTDVRQLPVYNKRLTLDGDKLLLTGVVKEDMGWYTCRPSNGIGHDEASAYLNVTYFPRVLADRMPVQVRWAKGFRERLDCPVDSNPPMVETIWTKSQSILDSRGRFDILINGTLLVENVQDDDSGSYSCTPVSLLGRGQPSPNVQVIVRDPPYFTLRPQALYQRQVGQSVVMVCAASGTPAPSIAWRKVGGVVDFADKRITQEGGNLSISATSKEDHGQYECVASNTIATILSPTELRILNTTPHAPYNVSIIPNLFSAEVSWAPAYDGGRPQFYMLWFRERGGDWGQLIVPRDGGNTFTVYSLQPDTDYEFMVLSRNDLGNGSFSQVVQARTLGYRPDLVTALPTDASGVTYFPQVLKSLGPQPTPARNVTAVVVDEKMIVVTWQPALDPPVPVFWYQVHYRLAGSSRWTTYPQQVAATSGTRLEMRDLDPGVYQVRVIAYGVLAFSMPSNTATADMSREEQLIPEAMIGGIVGGVLFLLVAVLLTTMAIIHSRRKESKARNGHTSYADVSYGKPEDINSLHREAPAKRDHWEQNGGGNLVTSITNDDSIFFMPRSTANAPTDMKKPGHDPYHSPYRRDYRPPSPSHPHHPPPYREDDRQLSWGRHPSLLPVGSQPLVFSNTQPQVTSAPRPRSRSHPSEYSQRFPSDPYDPRSPLPRNTPFAYPNPHRPAYPHDSFLPSSQPPPPYRIFGGSGAEDLPPKPSRAYDGPYRERKSPYHEEDSHYRERDGPDRRHPLLSRGSEHQQPSMQRAYEGPFHSFHSDEEDDVFPTGAHFPHPSAPSSGLAASLPRHSSMKPGAAPPEEEEEAPVFTLSDISSVLDPPQDQSPAPTLPPPRRSWQPSQESSRSVPPSFQDSGDGVGWDRSRDTERSLDRDTDRPLAHVWPSPKSCTDDSSDRSRRPLGYTRDRLNDVVDRVRHTPRSRSAPGDRYLDVSTQKEPHPPAVRDPYYPHHYQGGRTGPGYHGERRPDDTSTSSGIGSHSTSQSTSASHRPPARFSKPMANSMSSLLTPQESLLMEEEPSSHLPRSSQNPVRRDTSADENYEFDDLPALEKDIRDDLHRYSRLAGSGREYNPGDLVRDLYPKPRLQSQYADAAERFQKLREEFQHFRQHQQHEMGSPHYGGPDVQPPLYSMDSEML